MLAVHVFAIGLHCLDCVLPPRSFMRNNPFSRGHCSVSMEKFFVCSTAALTDPGLGMAATNKLGTAMSFLYCCLWPDAHGHEAGTYCPPDPRAELSGCCTSGTCMRSLPEQSILLYSWIACKYLCHFNSSYVFARTG